MYIIRYKILTRDNANANWVCCNSVEDTSDAMTHKQARIAIVRAGQGLFRFLLREYGMGKVFYNMPGDRVMQRELIVYEGQPHKGHTPRDRLYRIEMVNLMADDIPEVG